MRADYSELCYFWGVNTYPYIDLNYQNQTDNIVLDYDQANKNRANIFKEGNKFIEVSPALNIDVKTGIKVLSQSADYAFNPYISKSLSYFIKRYDIPILSIPYVLKKQSNLEKYKKKLEYEQQILSDFYEVPNINGRISIEDIIYNMR